MSESFNAKDSAIFGRQLAVEELVVEYNVGGSYWSQTLPGAGVGVVTVEFNEPIDHCVSVLKTADAGPTVSLVADSAIAIGSDGSSLVITLAVALTTNDTLVIRYVTKQS